MVAVIGGAGLGADGTRANFKSGSWALGHDGGQLAVNLANGNLLLQRRDEWLVGGGPEVAVSRVYNSQASLYDSKPWLFGFERSVTLVAGVINTAGSVMARKGTDGYLQCLSFDEDAGCYRGAAGDGLVDRLTVDTANNRCQWFDAGSQASETYQLRAAPSSGGRAVPASPVPSEPQALCFVLTAVADSNGNTDQFIYSGGGTAGQLCQIDSANGESLLIAYDVGGRVCALRTRSWRDGSQILQAGCYYEYDNLNRLTRLTVDLSPADASVADGSVYCTCYSYVDDSTRLSGMTQSDGTALSFEYIQIGAEYRLMTLIDRSNNRVTRFLYDSAGHTTTVRDSLQGDTVYTYDDAGRLLSLRLPSVNGVTALTSYTYDAAGRVASVTDPAGTVLTYSYDTQGNCIAEADSMGKRIERVYNANGYLVSETVSAPGDPHSGKPRYQVYDARNNLRFTVSAAGRVCQYNYDAYGRRVAELDYVSNLFGPSAVVGAPSEARMLQWVAQLGLDGTGRGYTQVNRIDYTFDGRGQLSASRRYVDAYADGVLETAQRPDAVSTLYAYDEHGRLAATGDTLGNTCSYTYDGLGRTLSVTDQGQQVSTFVYTQGGSYVQSTTAAHQQSVSVYDAVSGALKARYLNHDPASRYYYDALGRLRLETDPTGVATMHLYDSAGHELARIGGDGSLTSFTYNRRGQLARTQAYANRLSAAQLASLCGDNGQPTPALLANVDSLALAGLLPAADPVNDRSSWNLYDAGGHLATSVDALGFSTDYQYDGHGRLLVKVEHDVRLAQAVLDSLESDTTPAAAALAPGAACRITRHLYDADGLLRGSVDAEHYLTEYVYDGAGRLSKRIRYANPVSVAAGAAPLDWPLVRPAPSAADQYHGYLYGSDSLLGAEIDEAGYLTSYSYDQGGRKTGERRYASPPVALARDAEPLALALQDVLARAVPGDGDALTSFAYTAQGWLSQSRAWQAGEGRAVLTSYTYDADGRLASKTVGSSAAAARISTYSYNLDTHQRREQNGAGDTITTTFDAAGRAITERDGNGNLTRLYYDKTGRLAYSIDALGQVSERHYTAFGELDRTTLWGNRIGAAILTTLSGGPVNAALDTALAAIRDPASERTTVMSFDRDGRLVRTRDALGMASDSLYDAFGNVVQTRQQLGNGAVRTTAFDYDLRGLHRASVVDPAGAQVQTRTEYDGFGRAVARVDANGNRTTITYDGLGRVIAQADIDRADGAARITSTSSYDAFNHVLTRTDARNNVTRYEYSYADPLAPRMTVTGPGGMVSTTTYNEFGQVWKLGDALGNVTLYEYDRAGRLQRVTSPQGVTSEKLYDHNGNVVQTIDGNGTVLTYSFDAENRVLTRSEPGSAALTRYAFDGQVMTETDASGRVTQTTYDRLGRVSMVAQDPNGLNLRTTFSYDAEGHTLAVVQGAFTADARTVRYEYDQLGRRVREVTDPDGANLVTRYCYDDAGNMIAKVDGAQQVWRYAYDRHGHEVLAVDPEGNAVARSYDAEGHLILVTRYASALGDLPAPEAMTSSWADALVLPTGPSDRRSASIYRADGNIGYTVGAGGEVTSFAYDANGKVVASTAYARRLAGWAEGAGYASLKSDVADMVAADAANDRVVRTVYSSDGNALYTIDALRNTTLHRYDRAGREIGSIAYAVRLADNVPATAAAVDAFYALAGNAGANDRVSASVRDAAGRVRFQIDALGNVCGNEYDAAGRLSTRTDYARAVSGWPAAAASLLAPADVVPLLVADGANDRRHGTVYDGAGRARYTVDPAGAVTLFQYDQAGKLTRTTELAQTVAWPASGMPGPLPAASPDDRMTASCFDGAGRKIYQIDALGYVTWLAYDAAGRVVRSVRYGTSICPPGTALQAANALTADHALSARALAAYFDSLPAASHRDNRVSAMRYDASGHLLARVEADGSATAYTYNSFGDTLQVTRFSNTVTGWPCALSLPPADPRSDRTERRVPDRNGRVLFEQDGLGRTRAYQYDAFGNVTLTTELADSPAIEPGSDHYLPRTSGADRRSAHIVDLARCTSYRIDGEGRVSIDTTDAFGAVLRTTRLARPLAGWTSGSETLELSPAALESLRSAGDRIDAQMVYDGAGRMLFAQDALGRTTGYRYDAFGNCTLQTAYANSGRFDPAGGAYTAPTASAADRRQALVVDLAGRKRYRIDAEGRIEVDDTNAFGETVASTARAVLLAGWASRAENAALLTPSGLAGLKSAADRLLRRSVLDALGRTAFEQDGLGRVTGYVYNGAGDTCLTTRYAAGGSFAASGAYIPPVPSGSDQRSAVVRDLAARTTYRIAASGLVTVSLFDAFGAEIRTTECANGVSDWSDLSAATLAAMAGAGDRVLRRVAYDRAGQAVYTVDALGAAVKTVYDRFGEPEQTIAFALAYVGSDTDCAALDAFYDCKVDGLYAYRSEADRRSAVIEDRANRRRFCVDANGSVVVEVRNSFGEMVSSSALATALPGWSSSAPLPDATELARLISPGRDRTSYYWRDGAGQVLRQMDAERRVSASIYDAFGTAVVRTDYASLGTLNADGSISVTANAAADRRQALVEDLAGHRRFSIDAEGRITLEHTDSFGQVDARTRLASLLAGWAGGGAVPAVATLASMLSSADRTSRFAYDAAGQQTRSLDADQYATETTYDVFGAVSVIRRFYNRGYLNADGSIGVSRDDLRDRRSATVYNRAQRTAYAIDAEGFVIVRKFNVFGEEESSTQLAGAVANWAGNAPLPAADALERLRDPARDRSSYAEYDAAGRVRRRMEGAGRVSGFEHDAFGQGTVTTYYAAIGSVANGTISVSASPGQDRYSAQVYDRRQRRAYAVDVEGRVSMTQANVFGEIEARTACATMIADWAGGSVRATPESLACLLGAADRTSYFSYDASGKQVRAMDAARHVSETVYDAFGEVLMTQRYANRGSWDGGTVRVEADPGRDRREATLRDLVNHRVFRIDAEGRITEQKLNAFGEVVQRTALAAPVAGWAGGAALPGAAAIAGKLNASYDRVLARIAYDRNGRGVLEQDAAGRVTGTTYDPFGEPLVTTRYASNSGFNAAAATPPVTSADDQHSLVVRNLLTHRRYRVDAQGYVTEEESNAFGELVRSSQIARPLQGWASLPAGWTGNNVAVAPFATAVQSLAGVGDRTVRNVYGSGAQLLFTIGADGSTRGYRYDRFGALADTAEYAAAGTFTADGYLAPAASTADRHTEIIRDLVHHITYTRDAHGGVSAVEVDAFGAEVATTEFAAGSARGLVGAWPPAARADDRRRLTIDDLANNRTYRVDANGAVTVEERNNFNEIVSVSAYARPIAGWSSRSENAPPDAAACAACGGAGARVTARYVYAADGQVKYAQDAQGKVSGNTYSAFGELVLTTEYLNGAGFDAAGPASSSADRRRATVYDVAARKVYRIDPEGHVRLEQSDSFGRMVRVVEYANVVSGWSSRKESGAPTAASLAMLASTADRVSRYAYDDNGDLLFAVDAMNQATGYTYNRFGERQVSTQYVRSGSFDAVSGAFTAVADSGDRHTLEAYDIAGGLRYSIDASGALTVRQENRFGEVVSTTAYAQRLTSWPGLAGAGWAGNSDDVAAIVATLPALAGAGDRVVERAIYAGGLLRYRTDALGGTTGFGYNSFGEVTLTTRFAQPAALGAGAAFTPPQRSPNDSRVATVREPGSMRTYTIDAMGAVTLSESNVFGEEVRRVALARSVGGWRTDVLPASLDLAALASEADHVLVSRTYNALGQLSATVDALGYLTCYEYDRFGQRARTLAYAEPIPGWCATSTYDGTPPAGEVRISACIVNALGQVLYDIDPLGYVTQNVYGAFGQVLNTIRRANALAWPQPWPLSATSLAGLAALSSPDDRSTKTLYDLNGRAQLVIDGERHVMQTSYDVFGSVVAQTLYQLSLYEVQSAPGRFVTAADVDAMKRPADLLPLLALLSPTAALSPSVMRTEYDLNGRPLRQTSADGVVTAIEYDQFGRVRNRTVAAGTVDAVTVHRSYDAIGRLLTETTGWDCAAGVPTAISSTVARVYDDAARTLQVISPRGSDSGAPAGGLAPSTTTMRFDLNGRVVETWVLDEASGASFRTSATLYDAFGNALQSTDANGANSYAYYDGLNRKIAQVDATGHMTTTDYDGFGNARRITRHALTLSGPLDLASVPLVQANANDGVLDASFDKLNRQLETSETAGMESDLRAESKRFNAFGELVSKTTLGASWTYTYDHMGNMLSETLPTHVPGEAPASVTNSYKYDARGNRTLSIEALGLPEQRTTTYTYDKANRLLSKTGQAVQLYRESSNSFVLAAPVETYAYDLRGNQIQCTDANGNITRSYFDIFNHKVAEVNALGAMTQWRRDAMGNAWQSRQYGQPVVVPPDGRTLPVPASGDDVRVQNMRYDYAGRVVETSVAGVLLGSYNSTAVGSAGYIAYLGEVKTTTQYDRMGNAVKQIDANGNITRRYVDAGGRALVEVDAKGYVLAREYGTASMTERRYGGAPIVVTDAMSAADVLALVAGRPDPHVTVTQYNARGDVVSTSVSTGDGRVAVTRLHYNGLGLVARVVNPQSQTDEFMQMAQTGKAYRYDAQGRKVAELLQTWTTSLAPGGTMRTETRSKEDTSYNGLGLVDHVTQWGILAGVANRTIQNHYDAMGRLDWQDDAMGKRTWFYYDDGGRRTLVRHDVSTVEEGRTTVGQQSLVVRYDALGRSVRASTMAGSGVVAVKCTRYNLYGDVTGKADYDGVGEPFWSEVSDVDQLGRVWRTNAGGVTKINLYDANGNATLTLESAGLVDLAGTSQAAIASLAAMSGADGLAAMTMKMAVYDARNQLVRTIVPGDGVRNVMAQLAAGLGAAANGSRGASIAFNAASGVPAGGLAAGALNAGTVFGAGHAASSLAFDVTMLTNRSVMFGDSGDGWLRTTYNVQKIAVDIGAAGEVALAGGKGDEFEVELIRPDGSVAQLALASVSGPTVLDFSTPGDQTYPFASGTVKVYRRVYAGEAADGRVEIASGSFVLPWTTDSSLVAGDSDSSTVSLLGNTWLAVEAQPSRLVLSAQPPGTSRVVLGYRPAGSSLPYRFAGQATRLDFRAADFKFELGGAPFDSGAEFDYQYLALDAYDRVLNSGSGSFRRDPASGRVSVAEQPQVIGSNGMALRVDDGAGVRIAFLAPGRLSGVSDAPAPARASLRYRALGASAWINAVVGNGAAIGTTVAGSYNWVPPTAGGKYEYELTVVDASGAIVNQTGGRVENGVLLSYGRLEDMPGRARIGNLPPATSYVRVGVAAAGSTSVIWTQLAPSATDRRLFLLDTAALAPNPSLIYSYNLKIDAYDDAGRLLAGSNASINVGAANVVVSSSLRYSLAAPSAFGPANATQLCWKLGGLDQGVLTTQVVQAYDAFGNLVSQTDAMGNTTLQTFDHAGRVLTTSGARFEAVDNRGQLVDWTQARPTVRYTYDLDGNVTSVTDANGMVTSYRYANGYDRHSGKRLVEAEVRPFGGGSVWNNYNAFGELTASTDEVGRSSSYSYDGNGNLTGSTVHGETQYYGYDESGRRIWTRKVVNGLNDIFSRTSYDALGRITQTNMASNTTANQLTSYSYTYSNAWHGWRTVTREGGSARTAASQADSFGRVVETLDLGAHLTSRRYDQAGRLVHQESAATADLGRQDIDYDYYASGALKSVRDNSNRELIEYGYDANGNKVRIKTSGLSWAGQVQLQYGDTQMRYDSRNQLIRVTTSDTDIATAYDLVGNVRYTKTSYTQGYPGAAGAPQRWLEYWYDYDAMNRVRVSMGQLVNGVIDRSYTGASIAYDNAGRRLSVTYGSAALGDISMVQTERYTYDELDRIKTVDAARNGIKLHSTRSYTSRVVYAGSSAAWSIQNEVRQVEYDGGSGEGAAYANGRVRRETTAVYSLDGRLRSENGVTYGYFTGSNANQNASWAYDSSSYSYSNSDGNLLSTSAESYTVLYSSDLAKQNTYDKTSKTTTYGYLWRDGPKVASSTTVGRIDRHNADGSWSAPPAGSDDAAQGRSSNSYDSNGNLVKSVTWSSTVRRSPTSIILSKSSRSELTYQVNVNGEVARHDQIDQNYDRAAAARGQAVNTVAHRYTRSIMIDGITAGSYSNEGPQQRKYNLDQLDAPADSGGNGFNAQAASDFDQNFQAVGQRNGPAFGTSVTVKDGDTLRSIARKCWGDDNAWCYLAQANGLDGGETLVAGQVLRVPNDVLLASSHHTGKTMRPYLTNETVAQAAPAGKGDCGQAGVQIADAVAFAASSVVSFTLGAVAAVAFGSGVGAPLAIGLAAVIGAASAAAGDLARQGFEVATHMKTEINWSDVATSAAVGAVAGAIGGAAGQAGSAVIKGLVGALGSKAASEASQAGIRLLVGAGFKAAGAAASTAVTEIIQGKQLDDQVGKAALMGAISSGLDWTVDTIAPSTAPSLSLDAFRNEGARAALHFSSALVYDALDDMISADPMHAAPSLFDPTRLAKAAGAMFNNIGSDLNAFIGAQVDAQRDLDQRRQESLRNLRRDLFWDDLEASEPDGFTAGLGGTGNAAASGTGEPAPAAPADGGAARRAAVDRAFAAEFGDGAPDPVLQELGARLRSAAPRPRAPVPLTARTAGLTVLTKAYDRGAFPLAGRDDGGLETVEVAVDERGTIDSNPQDGIIVRDVIPAEVIRPEAPDTALGYTRIYYGPEGHAYQQKFPGYVTKAGANVLGRTMRTVGAVGGNDAAIAAGNDLLAYGQYSGNNSAPVRVVSGFLEAALTAPLQVATGGVGKLVGGVSSGLNAFADADARGDNPWLAAGMSVATDAVGGALGDKLGGMARTPLGQWAASTAVGTGVGALGQLASAGFYYATGDQQRASENLPTLGGTLEQLANAALVGGYTAGLNRTLGQFAPAAPHAAPAAGRGGKASPAVTPARVAQAALAPEPGLAPLPSAAAGAAPPVVPAPAVPQVAAVPRAVAVPPAAAAPALPPSTVPAQSSRSLQRKIEALRYREGADQVSVARYLARKFTHSNQNGDADRLVLGVWKGQDDGYIGEARRSGGNWFESTGDYFEKLSKGTTPPPKQRVFAVDEGGVATVHTSQDDAPALLTGEQVKNKAWAVNEEVLAMAIQDGVGKIEMVGVTPDEMVANRPESFGAREVRYLDAHVGQYGYVRAGSAWVKQQAARR